MSEITEILAPLIRSGRPLFWQGSATESTLSELERLLGVVLPSSLWQFLVEFGGGGVVGAEISGVEDNNPVLETKGTILGDTKQCREEFRLPSHLIVIFCTDEGVCWCLDTSNYDKSQECPVVSYARFSGKIDAGIASSFKGFLKEYVRLRSGNQ